jgi:hypothetical protein
MTMRTSLEDRWLGVVGPPAACSGRAPMRLGGFLLLLLSSAQQRAGRAQPRARQRSQATSRQPARPPATGRDPAASSSTCIIWAMVAVSA